MSAQAGVALTNLDRPVSMHALGYQKAVVRSMQHYPVHDGMTGRRGGVPGQAGLCVIVPLSSTRRSDNPRASTGNKRSRASPGSYARCFHLEGELWFDGTIVSGSERGTARGPTTSDDVRLSSRPRATFSAVKGPRPLAFYAEWLGLAHAMLDPATMAPYLASAEGHVPCDVATGRATGAKGQAKGHPATTSCFGAFDPHCLLDTTLIGFLSVDTTNDTSS